MQCEHARELLSAFIDGEVSGEQEGSLSAHLASCPMCSEIADDYRRIGQHVLECYVRPPKNLGDKIRASLALERHRNYQWRPFMQRAAILLLAVVSSALVTWIIMRSQAERGLEEREILAAHVRSLIQERPTQVASSDQHSVKPWFAGRIDFAPTVKDLGANGFALVGGRVDVVGDHRVAAIVYKRRQHLIDVFMWPVSDPDSPARAIASEGCNMITWTAAGMVYWLVSDLNAVELGDLQRLL